VLRLVPRKGRKLGKRVDRHNAIIPSARV
jgi:hypothetical protein